MVWPTFWLCGAAFSCLAFAERAERLGLDRGALYLQPRAWVMNFNTTAVGQKFECVQASHPCWNYSGPLANTIPTACFHQQLFITYGKMDTGTCAYPVETSCTQAVFVGAEPEDGLCGTDLFDPRMPNFDCSGLQLPDNDRGFGVEYEFVANFSWEDFKQSAPDFFSHWNWDQDPGVKYLSQSQRAFLGDNAGHPIDNFEVTSPKPPNNLKGLTGIEKAVRVVKTLGAKGIEANPSTDLHVHVNVGAANAGGELLDNKGLAAVFAAYAKYQLPINSLLSPGRQARTWSRPLLLGKCWSDYKALCSYNTCACIRDMFEMMYKNSLNNATWLWKRGSTYKNFQLNFAPVSSYKTIEFRGHSGTTNPERVARWVQFVLTFTHHFGIGPGKQAMHEAFFSKSTEEGFEALLEAQHSATVEDLFQKIGLQRETQNFFTTRLWEQGDEKCQEEHWPSDEIPAVQGACYEEADCRGLKNRYPNAHCFNS